MKKTSKKGFTLIELMIVMAIIAILAVLGIAAINSARKTARDTQRRANAKTMQTGLEAYYAVYKKYPKYDGTNNAAGTDGVRWNLLFDRNWDSNPNLKTFISGDLSDPNGDDLKLTSNNMYMYKWTTEGYQIRIAIESKTETNANNTTGELFEMK